MKNKHYNNGNTVAAQLLTATRRERDEALMNLKQSEFAVTLCRRRAERAETERDAALHKLKCMRELHGEEAWETLSVYAEQVRNEASMYEYQPGIGKTAFVEPRTKSEVLRDYGKENWVIANGGTETPFKSRSGATLLYMWETNSGRHAYLNVDTDMFLTDDEASELM